MSKCVTVGIVSMLQAVSFSAKGEIIFLFSVGFRTTTGPSRPLLNEYQGLFTRRTRQRTEADYTPPYVLRLKTSGCVRPVYHKS